MKAFLKKSILTGIGIFLLISVINLLIGILFWIKNYNNSPLINSVDVPYLYFVQDTPSSNNGFEIPFPITKPKSPNEIRILVLGGSVAYDMVNLSSSAQTPYFQNLLQKRFPDRIVTVLNGSLPAYVTEQEFIALQMHLQHYKPDLVVGLHGYNDIESFRLNHLVDDSYTPSPLFYAGSWNSPLFKIIESHKKKYEISSIWSGYYNHISKGIHYIGQSLKISRNSSLYIDDISDQRIRQYAENHINIVNDLKDFCKSKQFDYVNFLQPVKFYHRNDSLYYGVNEQPISKYLTKIYYQMEKRLASFPDHYSLTNLNPTMLRYTDDCHPDKDGYKFLAGEMAVVIALHIEKRITDKWNQSE